MDWLRLLKAVGMAVGLVCFGIGIIWFTATFIWQAMDLLAIGGFIFVVAIIYEGIG